MLLFLVGTETCSVLDIKPNLQREMPVFVHWKLVTYFGTMSSSYHLCTSIPLELTRYMYGDKKVLNHIHRVAVWASPHEMQGIACSYRYIIYKRPWKTSSFPMKLRQNWWKNVWIDKHFSYSDWNFAKKLQKVIFYFFFEQTVKKAFTFWAGVAMQMH